MRWTWTCVISPWRIDLYKAKWHRIIIYIYKSICISIPTSLIWLEYRGAPSCECRGWRTLGRHTPPPWHSGQLSRYTNHSSPTIHIQFMAETRTQLQSTAASGGMCIGLRVAHRPSTLPESGSGTLPTQKAQIYSGPFCCLSTKLSCQHIVMQIPRFIVVLEPGRLGCRYLAVLSRRLPIRSHNLTRMRSGGKAPDNISVTWLKSLNEFHDKLLMGWQWKF